MGRGKGDSVEGRRQGRVPGVRRRLLAETGADLHFTGLYIGDETPSRIVVSTDQGELTATILTLPGEPGWVAYYVAEESTSAPTGPRQSAGVTAYDENGRVMDALTRH